MKDLWFLVLCLAKLPKRGEGKKIFTWWQIDNALKCALLGDFYGIFLWTFLGKFCLEIKQEIARSCDLTKCFTPAEITLDEHHWHFLGVCNETVFRMVMNFVSDFIIRDQESCMTEQ